MVILGKANLWCLPQILLTKGNMIQAISKGLGYPPQTLTQLGTDWEQLPHCWCSVSTVAWKPSSRTARAGVSNVPPSCRQHLQLIQQVPMGETAPIPALLCPDFAHQRPPARQMWLTICKHVPWLGCPSAHMLSWQGSVFLRAECWELALFPHIPPATEPCCAPIAPTGMFLFLSPSHCIPPTS